MFDTCFPGVCPSVSLALVIVIFVLFCMDVSVCVFVGVCSLCVSIFQFPCFLFLFLFCFAVCITLWHQETKKINISTMTAFVKLYLDKLGETLKKSSLRANMQSTFVILLNVYLLSIMFLTFKTLFCFLVSQHSKNLNGWIN